MNQSAPPFHLAFPVDDLATAREFYAGVLGCKIGREADCWIDFNFYGHQITAHLVESTGRTAVNLVDGDQVPVRHFGAILEWAEWQALAEKLKGEGIEFIIGPKIRFKGKPGEQRTFFIRDPSGNALEFKTFKAMDMIFDRGR